MHRSWTNRGLTWIIALFAVIAVTLAPASHAAGVTVHPLHVTVKASAYGHAGGASHGTAGHHGASHEHAQETMGQSDEVDTVPTGTRFIWAAHLLELTDNRLNWTPDQPPKLLA